MLLLQAKRLESEQKRKATLETQMAQETCSNREASVFEPLQELQELEFINARRSGRWAEKLQLLS